MVEYFYDSWGKPLSCTGTLATTLGVLNPFRYRGYVYDEETQWYYLKSRYYDPETCRFVSADVLLSTGQGVLGHNCYAYCLNNPVALSDASGVAPNSSISKDKNLAQLFGLGLACTIVYASTAIDPVLLEQMAESLKSKVEKLVNDKISEYNDQSVYVMFYKEGKNAGKVGYVGRTNEPRRREQEHTRDVKKWNLHNFTVIVTGLTPGQARLVEQLFISTYRIQLLENARREIAVSKLLDFKNDTSILLDLDAAYLESEYLCFLGR